MHKKRMKVISSDILHPYERVGEGYLLHIIMGWKLVLPFKPKSKYEGWNFNSGNYLFTTDTKYIHVSKFYCPSM